MVSNPKIRRINLRDVSASARLWECLDMLLELFSYAQESDLFIINVGKRLIYLEKYIFNGRTYISDNQVIPPSYSNSNVGYRIDLPTNNETHVSVELFYSDEEDRRWVTSIIIKYIESNWIASTFKKKQIM